jgi:hypothetical protein
VDELEGPAFGRLLLIAPGLRGGWCFAAFQSWSLRLDNLASQDTDKRKKAKDGMFSQLDRYAGSIRICRGLLARALLRIVFEKRFVQDAL